MLKVPFPELFGRVILKIIMGIFMALNKVNFISMCVYTIGFK